jgi:hypothetical protein
MARNGDGLFRRDRIWCFRYKDRNGVYREKSTGKRKQSEAREYKHDFLEKLLQNQLPTDEAKWTLDQALEKWMEFRSALQDGVAVRPRRPFKRDQSPDGATLANQALYASKLKERRFPWGAKCGRYLSYASPPLKQADHAEPQRQ